MLTNLQLTEFVVKAFNAKWAYWYGTYGLPCTKSLYNSKKKQYPSHYGSSRTSKYMKQIEEGKWCADCIGLGKGFVWSNGQFETKPKYSTNGCPDKSADGMFAYAKSKKLNYGKISTIPEIPGIAVRMSGHVGYYIGGGYVIEERGFDYGCVKTKLKDRKWTDWYEFPGVTYVSQPAPDPAPEPDPESIPHDSGKYVLVTNGNYHIRANANKNSTSLGIAHRGESYPYLGITKDGWYNISYKEKSAWISKQCGKIIQEGKIYFTVKKGSWNIRKGPSTSYNRVGTVKEGDKLEYLNNEKNNWYNVKFGNIEGWISGKGIDK